MARVLVCWPKVLYTRGGTEALVHTLTTRLRMAGHQVDTLALPLLAWPHETVVRSALLWRLLDISNETDHPIDLVIATKFPSYFIMHPRKVVWLIHQFRQVYDWYGTDLSGYDRYRADDLQLVRWIAEHDRIYLQEARAIYTISKNVQQRLKRFLDLEAEVLYPPPPLEGQYYCDAYEPIVLVVQRLEKNKRTDLILRALHHVRVPYQAVIIGTGPEEDALRQMVRDLGLSDRVQFAGRVSDADLLRYYARCRLVVYVPYDEDYGLVPLEAWMARKPVVTATDSGGVLEFLRHEENGLVTPPEPEHLAHAIAILLDDRDLAQRWGETGWMQIRELRWDSVIATLLRHEGTA